MFQCRPKALSAANTAPQNVVWQSVVVVVLVSAADYGSPATF